MVVYTYRSARAEARRLRRLGHQRARAVLSRRWSVARWDWIPAWTVVLA